MLRPPAPGRVGWHPPPIRWAPHSQAVVTAAARTGGNAAPAPATPAKNPRKPRPLPQPPADPGVPAPSSPVDPAAASTLAGLGLPPPVAARLLRKAAKLREGPHNRPEAGEGDESGSDGSDGWSDAGVSALPPPGLPTRPAVEAAAAALLAAGLGVADVAPALEKAPGLLALPPSLIPARAAALRSRWGLSRGAAAALIRFRPALLCSRGARRRLAATLAALTAPRVTEDGGGGGGEGGGGGQPFRPTPALARGLDGRQLGALIDRCPPALWVPPAQVDAAWAALTAGAGRAGVPAAAALIARHPATLLLRGGPSAAAARVEAELVGAGVPGAAAAAAVAGAGARALAAAAPGHAAAVADGLRAAGLDEGTVAAALASAPAALLGAPSSREVELKARLALETLGAPPEALAHGPAARGLFRRDVGATVGPRFAFVAQLVAERAAGGGAAGPGKQGSTSLPASPPPSRVGSPGAPGRLLAKGRRAAVGTVEAVDVAAAQRAQAAGSARRPPPPDGSRPAWGFPIDALPPSTPLAAGRRIAAILRGDDADFAAKWAGVPPSEFAVFKSRWQAGVLPSLGVRVAPGGAPRRRTRRLQGALGSTSLVVPRPRRPRGRPRVEERKEVEGGGGGGGGGGG